MVLLPAAPNENEGAASFCSSGFADVDAFVSSELAASPPTPKENEGAMVSFFSANFEAPVLPNENAGTLSIVFTLASLLLDFASVAASPEEVPNENPPPEDDDVSLNVKDDMEGFAGVVPIELSLFPFGAGVELPSEKVDGPGVFGGVVTEEKDLLTLLGGVDNPGGIPSCGPLPSLTTFARLVGVPSP